MELSGVFKHHIFFNFEILKNIIINWTNIVQVGGLLIFRDFKQNFQQDLKKNKVKSVSVIFNSNFYM